MEDLRYGQETLDGVVVQNNPVNFIDPDGLTPQDRANWAMEQYNNNNDFWKGSYLEGYNHCNEFVKNAHLYGDQDNTGYPTILRNNGYPVPNVSDLADPNFARDKLDYLPIKDVQPGDIVVWYGNGNHHTAIATGNGQVIYQNATAGVKKDSISNVTKSYNGTTPVVRRYKY